MANTVEVLRNSYGGTIDFNTSVGLGKVERFSIVNKFGRNDLINIGTVPETVWTGGGVYPFPSAQGIVSIVSNSANDAPVLGGAITMFVSGTDDQYNEISEIVALAGTTPVSTTLEYYRISRMFVVSAGATGVNVGDLSASLSGTPISYIDAGKGQTLQAVYTVPLGKRGIIKQYSSSVLRTQTSGTADFVLYTMANGVKRARENWTCANQGSTFVSNSLFGGITVDEGTDVYINVEFVGANTTVVTGGFDILLEDK